jgi:energy-coupling factor transporter ATP-binding protein EcfA2
MAGALFVRADLHVHVSPDGGAPAGLPADYVREAVSSGISVLGITDHNSIDNVKSVIDAAAGQPLLVLPGIEVTTHQGHLVALFSPERLDDLADFHRALGLRPDPSDGSLRSTQSLLSLVTDVHSRGGLPILAHIDREGGIQARVSGTELTELLCHEGLAGLEFVGGDALEGWFSAADSDAARKHAWEARQSNKELRARGLARIMSSDAHDATSVGRDRTSRTLTRLRLDDPNFTAVRTALLFNPKGRCKAEVVLPPSYPRVTSATFRGGFLDGVELDFSTNLNCLIGGRGSGKSTALIAIRAALGAERREDQDDPDAPDRMPDTTIVRFVDSAGLEREAIRERGYGPYDENGDPVLLGLADLGQDESGALVRGYRDNPALLLSFLDSFCELAGNEEGERELLAQLADNAVEIRRTTFRSEELTKLLVEQQRLAAQFKAAEGGRLEELAVWARELATQGALITRVREQVASVQSATTGGSVHSLHELADQTQTDLSRKPVADVAAQIEASLTAINTEIARLGVERRKGVAGAVAPLEALLTKWQEGQSDFQLRIEKKQKEFEAQDLKVEAGEIRRLATRMKEVGGKVSIMKDQQRAHGAARRQRDGLLAKLSGNREERFGIRRSMLKRISDQANDGSLGLAICVAVGQRGVRGAWTDWLRSKFGFRSPRVDRLAELLLPQQLAAFWFASDWDFMVGLLDAAGDGAPFFSRAQLEGTPMTWDEIFALETMHLEDRPQIDVEEAGRPRREFDELSAGQQRSVLLSLLLIARGSDPLVIDQPEDHLDAPFVASAVVHHLERAKERRQVIVATHSANITVLGDAELVIPLFVEDGHGKPKDVGAVDRPETLKRVCELLEGGAGAYQRRGERYGFEFSKAPSID